MKLPRNVRYLSLVAFFSSFYLYLPILTIYLQRKGLSLLEVTSLTSILIGTIFLSEIPTGIIADKIGRKSSIIVALLFQLLGEIVFLFGTQYIHFAAISVIAGVGFAFQSGCIDALLYDSLIEEGKQELMKKAAGIKAFWAQTGHVLGAILSSFLLAGLEPSKIQLSIILTVVNVAIAFVSSFLLKEPKMPYESKEKSPLAVLKSSFTLINKSKKLRRIILFGLFTTPFVAFLGNFQPPYYSLAGINLFWLGITLGMGGVLAAVLSKYAYLFEKKIGMNKAIIIAVLLPAIFYFLMSSSIFFALAPVLFILNFGFIHLQDPLLADYYNIHIPSNIRATTLSSINMLLSLYIALLGLLIGYVADISVQSAFLLMGCLIFMGAIIFRINKSDVEIDPSASII
ncbi:MAG: hypothetical protein COY80_02015 [Candidatus Pacebacteria bacterium CG_4_10_14_0_8_um_filter_42_14]|nr:MAG: hypothetical protein COY80_02015 [Candidatus Pacebacteria bacterium CG_4_10_14_0_8_um_filter_42_14]